MAYIQLSVVTPCFNEEEVIGAFYESLKSTLDSLELIYEIIFIDDGSTDNTLGLLNQLAVTDPTVRVLSFTRNFGHQVAVTAGLDFARGEAIVTMDGDLQHPPDVIPRMLAELKPGVDVVYAVRSRQTDAGWLKRLTSWFYYSLLSQTVEQTVIPGAADFRLLSQRAVQTLNSMRERHRFLRGMVPWMGFPARTVSYCAPPRFAGRSKYTWMKMLRLAINGLFSFSNLPLNLALWLGILTSTAGFIYLVYILVCWVVWHDLVRGWGSLISSLLILGGIQLLCIGLLARYLGMVFDEVKQRPLYLLKEDSSLDSRTNYDSTRDPSRN